MSPAAAARDVGRRLPPRGKAVEVVGFRGCWRARGLGKGLGAEDYHLYVHCIHYEAIGRHIYVQSWACLCKHTHTCSKAGGLHADIT